MRPCVALRVFAMVVALAGTVQAPPSRGGVVHAALANRLPADGELPHRRALLDKQCMNESKSDGLMLSLAKAGVLQR